jgi:cytoskeletal protein CcmA (bactofilin family)
MPTVRIDKCCIHCGHALYVPPKAAQVRCPVCGTTVDARDVTLSGDVAADRTVTAGRILVDESARVMGDLVAARVEIAGRVVGTVLASQGCIVRATGKVAGAIVTRSLRVDPGAEIDATIERIEAA